MKNEKGAGCILRKNNRHPFSRKGLFLLLCHGAICRRLVATGTLFTAGLITIWWPVTARRFVI